jgi:hypothetical protein
MLCKLFGVRGQRHLGGDPNPALSQSLLCQFA